MIAIVVIAVVIGLAMLIDALTASRVEARLSATIEENADLATSPSVNVGGTPFILNTLLTGKISRVEIQALDLSVENIGIVNARTVIHNVTLDPAEAFQGEIVGKHAEYFQRTVSLDGVAFGSLLNMTDLDIANPYDISPSGGTAAEAVLTGTPQGFDDPVSVLVALRLQGPMFYMEVREILDSKDYPATEIEHAFTYSLDTRDLPLSRQASAVFLSGGSISFEAERANVSVSSSDLTPLDTGEGDDAAASEDAFSGN